MSKEAKGKLRGIHITPASNGYSIQSDHDGDEGMRSHRPFVATSRHAAAKHVGGLMAAHEGAGEPDADEQPVRPIKPGKQAMRQAMRGM